MNFVIAGPDIQPLGEIAALTDQLRVPRDLFDRQEGAARDGVAAEQSERGEKRQEPERQTDNVIKHVDACETIPRSVRPSVPARFRLFTQT